MTPATSRGAALAVAGSLALLMIATVLLSRAYVHTRISRAEALYDEGIQLAGHGHSAQAAEDFRAALVYEHNNEKYRMALARSLMELGRLDEAETHLIDLRADDPTNGQINLMLARIAARDHHDADAVTYYQRAIYGFWPEHATESRISARLELTGVLQRENKPHQVLAQLLDLASETPANDTPTRRRLATLLLANGSPQHAAEIYQAMLKTDRRDAAAEKGLGDTKYATGDFAGARKAYQEAQRDGLNDPSLDRAIADCTRILELDPTLVNLRANDRFERARVLLQLAAGEAQRCGSLPAESQTETTRLLQEKPAKRQDGDVVEMLGLAVRFGTIGHSCAQAAPGAALSAVLAKIQRQMAAAQ